MAAPDDSERILIVSADGHWGGPPSMYRDYMDPEFREDLDALADKDLAWREGSLTQRRFSAETLELIDPDETVRSGGERGGWEVGRRLAEMDRSGVAAEVILPGHQETVLPFFSQVSPPSPPRHRAAGARAYHRQLADAIAASDGRLFGVADAGPCHEMEQTVDELRWVAAHGFVGVSPPLNIADPDLPPLVHPRYEPFWKASAETGLALVVHAGYGFPQGLADSMAAMNAMAQSIGTEEMLRMSTLSAPEMSAMRIDQFPEDHPFRTALVQPRRIFWQLMLSGVFDRHPDLRLVFTEIRADWVPETLAVLDRYFSGRTHTAEAEPPGVLGAARLRRPFVDPAARGGAAPRCRPAPVHVRHRLPPPGGDVAEHPGVDPGRLRGSAGLGGPAAARP